MVTVMGGERIGSPVSSSIGATYENPRKSSWAVALGGTPGANIMIFDFFKKKGCQG
jgi:hypothetical protein